MEAPCLRSIQQMYICQGCPDERPDPCLVLLWRRFLEAVEDLAEREAHAAGDVYHQLAPSRIFIAALEAAALGKRPPRL